MNDTEFADLVGKFIADNCPPGTAVVFACADTNTKNDDPLVACIIGGAARSNPCFSDMIICLAGAVRDRKYETARLGKFVRNGGDSTFEGTFNA